VFPASVETWTPASLQTYTVAGHESLEEEKNADALLTKLAKTEVNQDAVAA